MLKKHGKYTRRGGPEREAAYRMRDQRTPVVEIAALLGVSEPTVWRWLRERPRAEPRISKVQGLLSEALRVLSL